MKKINLFLFVYFLLPKILCSQNFGWANQYSTSNDVINYAVTTDTLNNVYTTGVFQGTTDFDGSSSQFTLTAVAGDVFVQKSDSAGNFIWVRQIGGSLGEFGRGIKTDNAGNVYVCGYFQGIVDFDPGPGTYTLSSAGQYDCFVLKLDASGNFIWAVKVGGTLQDYCYGIALDQNNNIFVTGHFNSPTVDFNPGPGVYNLNTAGNYDCFVLKLDNSGNFLWAHKFGSTSYDMSESVTIDNSNNVIIAGFHVGTVDFDPGPSVFNLTSGSGSENAFILKLNAAGSFVWAKSIQSTGNSQINSVSFMGTNIYVGGTFMGTCDLDPSISQYTLSCFSSADAFIAKYDLNGNFVWGGGYQSPSGFTIIESVSVNSIGDVFAVGHHNGITDFDPSLATYTLSSLGSSYDFFLLKLNPLGQLNWVFSPQGISNDHAWNVTINKDNQIIYCGQFYTSIDFDPTPTVYTLTSIGSYDAFVSMLYECVTPASPVNNTPGSMTNVCNGNSTTLTASSSGTIIWYTVSSGGSSVGVGTNFITPTLSIGSHTYYAEAITCDTSLNRTPIVVNVYPKHTISNSATICAGSSYTLPSGSIVNTSGTYTSNLLSINGCDSIIVTNLIVIQPNLNVSINGFVISSLASGALYQWYDCNLNQNILGETLQSYTVNSNGSYAVIVTENGCQDTSVCTIIQNVNVSEYYNSTAKVLPNPTNGKFKVKFNNTEEFIRIKIYTALGEIVFLDEKLFANELELMINEYPGIYFIQIEFLNKPQATFKIIKQ